MTETLLRWGKSLGRPTTKKVTDYDCEVCHGSIIVEIYYSLHSESIKPYKREEVWAKGRFTKLKPELSAIALAKPKQFLETLIEIENEE